MSKEGTEPDSGTHRPEGLLQGGILRVRTVAGVLGTKVEVAIGSGKQ